MKMQHLSFLLLFLTANMYAGNGKSIIDEINSASNIPVFFIESKITVNQPQEIPNTPLTQYEALQLRNLYEPLEFPDEYSLAYAYIVKELNAVFGVEKFTLGNIDTVPKKTVILYEAKTLVEDWNRLHDKFIVYVSVSSRYNASYYSRINEQLEIDTYLEATVRIKFAEISDNEPALNYLNSDELTIHVKSKKFIQEGIFTDMLQFTKELEPASIADVLIEKIPGSFDKFYQKQKKIYAKANK